jgi:DNA-binding transcriptional ArsR family regulator
LQTQRCKYSKAVSSTVFLNLSLASLEHFIYNLTMDVLSELSDVAVLLGEPARALMLWNLLDGQARPAGELAFFANVSPQSASLHLAKLVEAGMLSVKAQGRHRYYTITRPEVAHAIESMATLVPSAVKNTTLPRSQMPDLRMARTCYDHLAGRVAVEIVGTMQKQGLLSSGKEEFFVTASGLNWFSEFSIEVDELKRQRRAFARKCLDWSERQYHLAGSLGAALLQELVKRKWLARQRTGRVVSVTLEGRRNLGSLFGIHL